MWAVRTKANVVWAAKPGRLLMEAKNEDGIKLGVIGVNSLLQGRAAASDVSNKRVALGKRLMGCHGLHPVSPWSSVPAERTVEQKGSDVVSVLKSGTRICRRRPRPSQTSYNRDPQRGAGEAGAAKPMRRRRKGLVARLAGVDAATCDARGCDHDAKGLSPHPRPRPARARLPPRTAHLDSVSFIILRSR